MSTTTTPPVAVGHEAYSTHSAHASVGPVIAVLAVIAILGAVAGMIGRLCSGRKVMGHYQYDVEGWVEAKFASCIDGSTLSPAPRPPLHVVSPVDAPEDEEQSKRAAEQNV